jgi:D-amino peptidase
MLGGIISLGFVEPLHAQGRGLKIYISADMEGVVGTTREVLAAIDAAREAGATEIMVSDSHGNGENLLIEMLPDDVTVVRSWPRHLGMMQGIDESFDAVIFIGYHAGTTNPEGVRAHTMSSGRLADIRLNGQSQLEASINAAIAGHFGVPVIMISGDDAAVAQARDLIGNLEGAVVKWNYGFHSARTMTPNAAYQLISEKVKAAIARIDSFEPLVLPTPVTLEVQFKNYRPSEVLAYLSIVDRPDAHSIRFVGQDMVEISKFLQFVTTYDAGLTP